jgi:hypothetical protein
MRNRRSTCQANKSYLMHLTGKITSLIEERALARDSMDEAECTYKGRDGACRGRRLHSHD